MPARAKLQLALDLAPVLSRPAEDGLPRFSKVLAHNPVAGAAALGRSLDSVVEASVTRAFRRAFLLAALLALLTWLPVHFAVRGPRRYALPAAAGVLALALVGAELARGALDYGTRPALSKPCAARTLPATAGTAERTLVSGLDAVACRLHTGREQLIARVAGSSFAAEFARDVQRASTIPGWLLGLLAKVLER